MKKTKSKTHNDITMRTEYDFSNAIRGRAYRPLHKGYSLKIHNEDGTTVVQHFKIQEGTILLAPDVRPYFPDSDSVNNALRALLSAMPKTIKRKRSQQHAAVR